MLKPKIGKTYWFVRVHEGEVQRTEYVRWGDGSSGFDVGDCMYSYDNNPDAWLLALQELARLGFVEEREAKSQGYVAGEEAQVLL